MNKVLSFLCAVCLIISVIPASTQAATVSSINWINIPYTFEPVHDQAHVDSGGFRYGYRSTVPSDPAKIADSLKHSLDPFGWAYGRISPSIGLGDNGSSFYEDAAMVAPINGGRFDLLNLDVSSSLVTLYDGKGNSAYPIYSNLDIVGYRDAKEVSRQAVEAGRSVVTLGSGFTNLDAAGFQMNWYWPDRDPSFLLLEKQGFKPQYGSATEFADIYSMTVSVPGVAAVPVPAGGLLLIAGLGLLGFLRVGRAARA